MIQLEYDVWMVTRAEWGARPPRSVTAIDPDYGSTGHWEGPHMGAFPHESCASKVRGIQNYHMDSQGWQDIAYTYLCCPHDFVFEGRGIGARTAANGTNEGNNRAYAVCYLGGEGDGFTARTAMRAAFDRLDHIGGAGPGRNCHRDWKPTECPGNEICGWIKAGQPIPEPPPIPIPVPPLLPDLEVPMQGIIYNPGDGTTWWFNTDKRYAFRVTPTQDDLSKLSANEDVNIWTNLSAEFATEFITGLTDPT